MASSTWVIVADNCKARVFRLVKFPEMEELESLIHPESKMQGQDINTEQPGKGFVRGSGERRYSYEPKFSTKDIESERFAAYVADFLNHEAQNQTFNRLYLMAEPSFLGHLRKHLSAEVHGILKAEVPKLLTSADQKTIEKQLQEV